MCAHTECMHRVDSWMSLNCMLEHVEHAEYMHRVDSWMSLNCMLEHVEHAECMLDILKPYNPKP
jgi:hypothetical protein